MGARHCTTLHFGKNQKLSKKIDVLIITFIENICVVVSDVTSSRGPKRGPLGKSVGAKMIVNEMSLVFFKL